MKQVSKLLGVGALGLVIGIGIGSIGGEEEKVAPVKKEVAQEAEAPKEVAPVTAPVVEEKPVEEVAPAVETTLGTGEFIVGEDINSGRYTVSTQESGGNFFVFDSLGFSEVNEMLGTNPDYYVNNITVTLEEGQSIKISGLNAVLFSPK